MESLVAAASQRVFCPCIPRGSPLWTQCSTRPRSIASAFRLRNNWPMRPEKAGASPPSRIRTEEGHKMTDHHPQEADEMMPPARPEPALSVNKITWPQVGRVAEPGRYMFKFGWLTVT